MGNTPALGQALVCYLCAAINVYACVCKNLSSSSKGMTVSSDYTCVWVACPNAIYVVGGIFCFGVVGLHEGTLALGGGAPPHFFEIGVMVLAHLGLQHAWYGLPPT